MKVALQLSEELQASVAVKEMVVNPPQESGGENVDKSVVSTSHPPAKENWLIQLSQASLISCCEAHKGVSKSGGHNTLTGVGSGTVKVAEQV